MPFDRTAKGSLVPRKRTARQVLDAISKEGVKFVDLQLTDVPGRLRHVTIPSSMVSEKAFSEGVAKLDGSSIKGFVEIFESDMVLLPDPSTLGVVPWGDPAYKVARLICDVEWGFGKGRFSRDPRYVTQKAEEKLKQAGYTNSLWGPEVEFFVFDSVTWDVFNPFSSSFKITSKESALETRGTNFPIRFKEGYYPAPPVDTLMDYRSECVTDLWEGFGIPCNAHHHEVATAGQCEIDMYRDTLAAMGDNVVTYKYVTKNVAQKRGMIASTMPKPIFGDNAVGMHVASSLWKGERNAFFDANDDYAEVSQVGRYYIGGLLEHSRALCAITNPTTNSYRRLVLGYEAPVYIAWSRANRSANVRIPVYEKGKGAEGPKRAEFRTPDPSCNPYLAFAAIAAAGLDGIKKKIDPGSPVDEDIYKLTPKRKKELGVGELPGSLQEAIESLESDSEFLKDIFGNDMLETIREIGMENYRLVSARPHPFEFHLYFDL
ncbi:MAG: type I glutamate--ammonia ligase [Thaumarchaeota archaeon]|nr:type I glutamate--ammonia ligase [Nitrososphaerota archaeon]